MLVLWNSIQSILVIILIMALGYILRRIGWLSNGFSNDVSRLILDISLPASIFVTVLQKLNRSTLINFSKYLLLGAATFVIGYMISIAVACVMKVKSGRRGAFINAFTNPNTVFIGLPLNVALFGNQSLKYFLVYYVLDVFSTWTVGLFLINHDDPTKRSQNFHLDWKKIFPVPLLSFFVAVVIMLLNFPVLRISFLKSSLIYVGNLVTPLSLIYIGIILANNGLRNLRLNLDTLIALVGRFVIIPIIMIVTILIALNSMDLPKLFVNTMVIQSAVPAIAVLPILVHSAHGDVKYSANVVSISTVLFIFIIPILMLITQHL